MDFFASQGTAVPSTGSSGGNWEDWFLDMKGRKPFGRTAYPDPDAERGDWIDWYLNREGPAGKFRGSKRPRYDINYLFNDGGSVQSGPRTRQKLQQRNNEPGTGQLRPNIQEPWNNPGPGSFWNASAPRQTGNNTGVMAAMANNPMVQQAKGFYNLFDPWMPNVDVGENSFGYEFEKPILGGTLGYGFDYDWDDENVGAFFNWKKGLGG